MSLFIVSYQCAWDDSYADLKYNQNLILVSRSVPKPKRRLNYAFRHCNKSTPSSVCVTKRVPFITKCSPEESVQRGEKPDGDTMSGRYKYEKSRRRRRYRRRDRDYDERDQRREQRSSRKKRSYSKSQQKKIDTRKIDFSPKAIKKQVARETIRDKSVVYPFGFGAVAGVAALLFGSPLLIAAAATGVFVGTGSWIFNNTLRRQKHVSDYLSEMNTLLAGQTKQSIIDLRRELQRVREEQGLKQIDLLQNKYNAFNDILANKFNKGEITFTRYHAMVEQVFLAVLDNLKQITNMRQAINVIDEGHITKRINDLQSRPQTRTGQEELDALIGRYRLLQNQRDKVQERLAQNESAMTKMDEVMAAISVINPGQSQASMDMEDAMKELETLALRASSYSSS